jgi:hypothetical protein
MKIKYSHKIPVASIKTKTSENKPNIKILISSVQINVVSVMGWKSSVILKMKLTAT